MFTIMPVGFIAGFAVSAPLGAIAMLAMVNWIGGLKRKAIVLAAAVCLGDLILAGTVMTLLHFPLLRELNDWLPTGVPPWTLRVGIAVALLVIGVRTWSIAYRTPKEDGALEQAHAFFWAVVITFGNPMNWGVYLSVYGWLLPYFGLQPVEEMTAAATSIMLIANSFGMVSGWVFWTTIVELGKRWAGDGVIDFLRPLLMRGVSMVTLGAAVFVAFDIRVPL